MSNADRGERDVREPLLWIFAGLAVIVAVIALVTRGDDVADASFAVDASSTAGALPTAVPLPTPEAAPTPAPALTSVTVEVAAEAVTIRGTVPDRAIVEGLRSAAGSVVDIDGVTVDVAVDDGAVIEGATLALVGEVPDDATRRAMVRAFSTLGFAIDDQLVLTGSDLGVAGVIAAAPRVSQFSDFLVATGLDVELDRPSDEGITVFAPTDRALLALNETLGGSLPRGEALQSLLEFHVVDGTYTAADLARVSRLTTRQGEVVGVAEADGIPVIGGSLVVTADLRATNGVVHLVDAVLLPGTLQTEVRLNDLVATDPIQFAAGSAQILAESEPILDRVVEILLANVEGAVEIQGHTDTQGRPAPNKRLSQDRADAVRRYLIDAGVAADRLTAVGYGERTPLVEPEETDADRAANRRIEFRVG